MLNKNPKVFIVVLNWNRKEDTLECLNSVSQLSVVNYQLSVIVVDNASTDGSLSSINKFKSENFDLRVMENKENLGYAAGNNVGIRYAMDHGADFVMILNNDTIVDKNLLVQLIESVKKGKVGAVSPKIYFASGFEFHKERYSKSELGRVIWYAGGLVDWENVYGSGRGVDEVDNGQYDKEVETDVATGTCILLNKDALESVGLFDEKYFMYYEDTDLSQRLKKAGWKVLYEPKGMVWHKVAQSSGIGSGLNDYYTTRNRMLFGMGYAKLRTKVALIKESIKLLLNGRKWQKIGVRDFYLGNFGKGSWND